MQIHEVYFSNLNIVCNSGGYFAPARGETWAITPHAFSQNKFYYITKGKCRLTIDGKEYIARAGDWFFIPAGTEHSYANFPDEPFEKYWMHFDIQPNHTVLTSLITLPHHVTVPQKGEAARLFARYARLYDSQNLTDRIMVKSILIGLVAEYIRLAHPEEEIPVQNTTDTRLDEILKYIKAHMNTPLSVSELAAEFHLHPNHFNRFFKSRTGQTPARYIKMLKMETAKRYLEKTDLNITEIMGKIGQTDLCSFSKQFKSIYSHSPQEYRRFFRMN